MKKTIFISSTFEDLKSYRGKVWDLLESYDVEVRGMEKFGARKEAPLVTCLSEVEQSNIFVAIIAYRAGSIDNETAKSFTQLEYERAYDLGQEILIYLIDEKDSKVSIQQIDFNYKRDKLIAFKSILKQRHTPDYFVSEDDLVEKLKRRLDELLSVKTKEDQTIVDEFENSKDLIEKFTLLPAVYSGREVKLIVDFQGSPFPASKSICSNFNLEYGKTIGIPIQIKKPDIDDNPIEYLFIDKYGLEDFLSLPSRTGVQLYGILQFSESKIEKFEANFVRQVYHTGGALTSIGALASIAPILGETHIIEPDGTIILRMSKIVK